MRLILLLLLLGTASAQAQPVLPPETLSPVRHSIENVAMSAGGFAVGITAASLVGSALNGSSDRLIGPAVLLAYSVGVASGVHGVGQLAGAEGTFRNTLGDATAGTLLGAAGAGAILAVYGATRQGSGTSANPFSDPVIDFDRLGEEIAVAMLALGVAATVPVVWAVTDYRNLNAAPALMRNTEGETAAGLALRVRF